MASQRTRKSSQEEEETLHALGFTKTQFETNSSPRDKYGSRSTFAAERDAEFGSDVRSGTTFYGLQTDPAERDSGMVRVTRDYNNKSPEDSGFGDEKLEKLSSPRSKDGQKPWSFELKSDNILGLEETVAPWAVSPELARKEISSSEKYESEKPLASPPERDTDYMHVPTPSFTSSTTSSSDNNPEICTTTTEIIHRKENSLEQKEAKNTSFQMAVPSFQTKKIGKVAGPREFLGNQKPHAKNEKWAEPPQKLVKEPDAQKVVTATLNSQPEKKVSLI